MSVLDNLQINVSEVVNHQRFNGVFANELRSVVERKIAAQAAREAGLTVGDEELQKTFDVWRVAQGLHRAEETSAWLERAGLSLEAVEEYLETNVLLSKWKDKLHAECDVNKYLALPQTQELIRDLAYSDWLTRVLT